MNVRKFENDLPPGGYHEYMYCGCTIGGAQGETELDNKTKSLFFTYLKGDRRRPWLFGPVPEMCNLVTLDYCHH